MSLNDWVKKNHPEIIIEEEIILNCQLIPANVIDSEVDVYCEEGQEYNVPSDFRYSAFKFIEVSKKH